MKLVCVLFCSITLESLSEPQNLQECCCYINLYIYLYIYIMYTLLYLCTYNIYICLCLSINNYHIDSMVVLPYCAMLIPSHGKNPG